MNVNTPIITRGLIRLHKIPKDMLRYRIRKSLSTRFSMRKRRSPRHGCMMAAASVYDGGCPRPHGFTGHRRGAFGITGSHPLLSYNLTRRIVSKEDSIEVTGTVVEKFPSGLF